MRLKESGRPRGEGSVWIISRADLAAGGGELIRLQHPSLPEMTSARMRRDGLLLGPKVARPRPLDTLVVAAGGRFLVRLAGLLGFLKAHGLGIAPSDIEGIGCRAEGEWPWLVSAPVPEWRAAPHTLVVAAAALRLGGDPPLDVKGSALKDAVESALTRHRGPMAELAAAALASERVGRGVEALLRDLAAREGGSVCGRDLLGLTYPAAFAETHDGMPVSAAGAAALWVARGLVRRRPGDLSFVEVAAAASLEEGGTLRRIADVLAEDPRAAFFRTAAAGRAEEPPDGPPLAVVVSGAELCDPRSRAVLSRRLGSLLVVTVRARPQPPWEEGRRLAPRLAAAEAAELFFLPFVSSLDAARAWEEVAALGGGDATRFLQEVDSLSRRFEPARGRSVHRSARRPTFRHVHLAAAAILADGFTVAEVAVAAGLPHEEIEPALADALAEGRLEQAAPERLRFSEASDRERCAERLSARARRDAVERLERAGVAADRIAVAALSRGEAADIVAARELLPRWLANGSVEAAADLLSRVPREERASFDSLDALAALLRAGRVDVARDWAVGIDPRMTLGRPLAARISAACSLVKLGQGELALALVPGVGEVSERLARARVLLDLHRDAEAAELLRVVRARSDRLESTEEGDLLLLESEASSRRGDYATAELALSRVADVVGETSEVAAHQIAMNAGTLASDLGRPGEAAAFFRRARDAAPEASQRASACFDLAAALMLGGRFVEAERELEDALALYVQLGFEDDYVETLGNRVELAFLSGRYAAARADLARVLRYDRDKGRAYQLLFSLPTVQRLALLDGDVASAEDAHHEGAQLLGRFPDHPARRELLVLEGARLLMVSRATEAARILELAAEIPDNRMRNEPLRQRLLASARADLGHETCEELPPRERVLLAGERALRHGGPPPPEVGVEFERKLGLAGGPGEVVWRLLEWEGRFPEALASCPELVALGLNAAGQAGLGEAAGRLRALAARKAPPPFVHAGTEAVPASPDVVAEDATTRQTLELVARLAPTQLSVLILGESGTGKELVAHELHTLSRRSGPFVPVNVAALPETLIESELFGHARGAFSGADRDRVGLVETAQGGTLFLDEIGDLPLPAQAKLLRVLQEREVRRVGEVKPRRVDLRVVSATHRDLPAMVERQAFRGDLYHRLNGHAVHLLPLRQRPKDLARLLSRFAEAAGLSFAPEARCLLSSYSWPGNVRELTSPLESARALASPGRRIEVEHLPAALRATAGAAPGNDGRPVTYRSALEAAQRQIFEDALRACGGNRTRAAQRLGMARQSLIYELKKLKLT